MAERTFDEQLTKYLTDAHSIEVQALAQLRFAPRIAGDDALAAIFREHFAETETHEQLVRGALERRDASPSLVKDAAGRVAGWGQALFAQANPDTPGKLAAHAYSYEHLELATYELLRRVAERAGDADIRQLAVRIGEDERAMADRIAERFDLAVDASLREKGAEDPELEVQKYLRDCHAIEAQALQMLEAGPKLVDVLALEEVYRVHLEETREHQRLVDERLAQLGSGPSRFQAAALRMGAMNLGGFFKVQPDTPLKLAGFTYAFEGLEAAAYELLMRTARRFGDEETARMAERILRDEHAQAERLAQTWDASAEAALRAQGVTG